MRAHDLCTLRGRPPTIYLRRIFAFDEESSHASGLYLFAQVVPDEDSPHISGDEFFESTRPVHMGDRVTIGRAVPVATALRTPE